MSHSVLTAGEQVLPAFCGGLIVGAPYKDAYKKYELTPEGIAKRAKATIDYWKGISSETPGAKCVDVKPIRSPMRRAFEQLI